MDLLISSLSLATSAFALGTVVADWRHRSRLHKELASARLELHGTVKAVGEAHNGLAAQLIGLQDQINSHELRIGAAKAGGPSSWTARAADLTRG